MSDHEDDEMPVLEAATTAERPEVREGGEGEGAKAVTDGLAQLELNKKADVYRLNLGHQETDRILDEVDQYVHVSRRGWIRARNRRLPHHLTHHTAWIIVHPRMFQPTIVY